MNIMHVFLLSRPPIPYDVVKMMQQTTPWEVKANKEQDRINMNKNIHNKSWLYIHVCTLLSISPVVHNKLHNIFNIHREVLYAYCFKK